MMRAVVSTHTAMVMVGVLLRHHGTVLGSWGLEFTNRLLDVLVRHSKYSKYFVGVLCSLVGDGW